MENRKPSVVSGSAARRHVSLRRSAAHLSTILPNCRFETLPEDGHFYLLRDPAVAVDRIRDFLVDPAGQVVRV
jgi:hypothetical protein